MVELNPSVDTPCVQQMACTLYSMGWYLLKSRLGKLKKLKIFKRCAVACVAGLLRGLGDPRLQAAEEKPEILNTKFKTESTAINKVFLVCNPWYLLHIDCSLLSWDRCHGLEKKGFQRRSKTEGYVLYPG